MGLLYLTTNAVNMANMVFETGESAFNLGFAVNRIEAGLTS